MGRATFDAAYYQRFYGCARTRVADRASTLRLAAFVVGYLRHLRLPLRNVLDAGCGIGLWRDALRQLAPRASYLGLEVSDYLCARFGWTRGSVADWNDGRRHDLVVCQGVLQYLDARAARAAVANLARLTRGVLYLEALTRGDWRENADRARTDGNVHLRSARWYRTALGAHFVPLGGGLHLARDSDAVLFELERPC
jgi:hypothetical protein